MYLIIANGQYHDPLYSPKSNFILQAKDYMQQQQVPKAKQPIK